MLKISDPTALLEWAQKVSYDKLTRFIDNRGADGHSDDTVKKLIHLREERRWGEEDRIRESMKKDRSRPVQLTRFDRLWKAAQRRESTKLSLEALRGLEPSRFESFVADLFTMQGYQASAVGGPSDCGVDVEVRNDRGELWAVVQCKRYAQQSRVHLAQVMAFAGAFVLRKAQCGYIFTTGELTRNAKNAASGYSWLTVYSGSGLVLYLEQLKQANVLRVPAQELSAQSPA